MKKFLTIAAAVATSAVLITSVFAETTNDLTATYDPSTGIITLGNAPTLTTTTYIVFDRENQEGFATDPVAEGQIKQINQEENAVTEIYVGPLADGKYQVRLGGDGNVRNGLFEVASATPTPTPTVEPTATPTAAPTAEPTAEPEVTPTPDLSTQEGAKEYYKTCDRLMGDIDGNSAINLADAGLVLAHELNPSLTRERLQASDVDGNKAVNLADAGIILAHDLGDRSVLDGKSKVKDKTSYILEN